MLEQFCVMAKKSDWCFNTGWDDGRNKSFDSTKAESCGMIYNHGFMSGYLSIEGNDRGLCGSAEDG